MIDFRYHLVSLISVFIALALGVVLGAGPLQEPIANGLTGQVKALQETQAQNQIEIEKAHTEVEQRNQWIDAITEVKLEDRLKNRQVALVIMPGARTADIEYLTQLVTLAGGTINQRLTVEKEWLDKKKSAQRKEIIQELLTGTSPDSKTNNNDQVLEKSLGEAIITSLTSNSTAGTEMRTKLASKEPSLLTYEPAEPTVSDTILMVGAPAQTSLSVAQKAVTPKDKIAKTAKEAKNLDPEALLGIANAITIAPNWGVIIGDGESETGMVTVLRNHNVKVTTVDTSGTIVANATAVLALENAKDKATRIGFSASAQQVIPNFERSEK